MNQVSQEPILKTRGLSKHFGGAQVINQVDLQIRRGEVRCVIGPNGAVKVPFSNYSLASMYPVMEISTFSISG